MTQSNVRAAFERHFNTHGTLYASAGRINLIGEHTDYNGGFVFPGAVDCGITAMIRPNGTDRVRAYAVDLDSYAEFGLREEDKPSESWARYIFGVCREIQKRGGKIGGFDTVFAGDVPLGAGMSSVIRERSHSGRQPHSSRAQVSSSESGQLRAISSLTGSMLKSIVNEGMRLRISAAMMSGVKLIEAMLKLLRWRSRAGSASISSTQARSTSGM